MDMFLVVIIAAMLVTAGTLFLGLLSMAGFIVHGRRRHDER